jgi:hypothetical protein
MPFNPFPTRPGERLTETDMLALISQGVAEGYYVEYKRQLPAATKIARSLASFANTYGGWYIIGVETDAHNVATSVPGFTPAEAHDPVSVVRDAARHGIDPAPLFFPQVVSLTSGASVCVVYVPGQQASPFVTRDGRIYRRISDASEPVPESSRHALDELIQRGKAAAEEFVAFADDERTFSQAEEHVGWANLFIAPEPLGLIVRRDLASQDAVARVLALSREPHALLVREELQVRGNLPFNTAYPTASSIIMRQVTAQGDAFHALSAEYDEFGRARIHIPLVVSGRDDGWATDMLRSTRARNAIETLIFTEENSNHLLKQLWIGQLWMATATNVAHYLAWLGAEGLVQEFRVALRLEGAWRCVPFVDSDHWADYIETFGVPAILRDSIALPSDFARPYRMMRKDLVMDLWHAQANALGLTTEVFSRLLFDALTAAQDSSR